MNKVLLFMMFFTASVNGHMQFNLADFEARST
jgi:hypothetical protein